MKDFTRKRARVHFAKILVAPTAESKQRIVWATFRNRMDAELFYDQLRRINPTWVMEFRP